MNHDDLLALILDLEDDEERLLAAQLFEELAVYAFDLGGEAG